MTIASAPARTSLRAIAESRREADDAGAAVAQALDRRARRNAAGEHDMPDAAGEADLDQLAELRVHRDQVDAERLRR